MMLSLAMVETGNTKSENGDMSLLAKEFPLFKDAVIRVDRTTEVVRASVLDVFAMVLGASNTARMAWKSIRDKCVNTSPVDNGAATADVDFVGQTIFKKVGYVTFPGMSKPTPVAPFSALLELIYLLPGKRAHQVRSTSAKYMSRLLAGDLTLIDEIEARFDNTTEEERDMFLAGTDEPADRKRRREEMEEDRVFRIRRETAEVIALELKNALLVETIKHTRMTEIEKYRTLLTSVGLGNDPTMQQTVVDAVANIFTPIQGSTVPAITGPQYCIIDSLLKRIGIVVKSTRIVGGRVAKLYRTQFGKNPDSTMMHVNGALRQVNKYEENWLRANIHQCLDD